MAGYFLVLDGMDGSGKSLMIQKLHNYLFSKGKHIRVLSTREPTMGTFGKKIREMLATETDPKEHADELVNLFVSDRKEHVDSIIFPFLKHSSGDDVNIVVCDRYYHSTIAFQSTQGFDRDTLIEKNKNFPKPTRTFILDLEPHIAIGRMKSRSKEKFEDEKFMVRLREQFLELPALLSDEEITIIDASKDKNAVFEQIKKEVDKILEK